MRRLAWAKLIITLLIGVALVNVSHAEAGDALTTLKERLAREKKSYECKNSQGRVVDKKKGHILSRCPEGVFIYSRREKGKKQYMACDADSGKIRLLFDEKFADARCFVGGLALVSPTSGVYGFIDETGAMVIEPKFLSLGEFSEGLAAAKPVGSSAYGYIDETGGFVIEPKFVAAYKFYDGMAKVSLIKGVYGYIDKTGELVVEPKFTYADNFRNGRAMVRLVGSSSHGYIDKTGEFVIEPITDNAGVVNHGVWLASAGFIDNSGKLFDSNPFATVIVNEQFEDNQRGWPVTKVDGIDLYTDVGYDIFIANGQYNIDYRLSRNGDIRISLPRDFDPDRDFVINAKFAEGGDRGFGVIGLMWGKYVFMMNPDGRYSFFNNDEARMSLAKKGHHSRARKMYREFTVKKTGDIMLFFVDEKAVDFLPFDGFSETTAGFFVERKVGFLVSGLQNFSVDSLVITQSAESSSEQTRQ